MLDRILNNNSEIIKQSQSLDRIGVVGSTNPFEEKSENFFIDESLISNAALQKYQHEIDVKVFSDLLMKTDQKAADNLVMQQVFDQLFSIDSKDFLSELLENEDFLNDITR